MGVARLRGMIKWKNRARLLVVAVLILAFGVGSWFFYQSTLLSGQADGLFKSGREAEALVLYQRAQALFPLRRDLSDDIAGTKLVIQSSHDYGRIADFFEEYQEVPPLSSLPAIQLAPNELYVPVLMYHHIRVNPMPRNPVWAALNVSAEQLDQQFAYLSSHNYHTITLDELRDALDGKISLPENPIVLTFDDGYRNFYDSAFPLLKKYNFKATQFVITAVAGTSAYLTWEQISIMDKSGLVTFGAHTRNHPNLPDISQARIVDEIRGSKADLEQHLGKTTYWFAYPYGSYSASIMQTVQDAGFRGAASTVYGAVQRRNNMFLFPRIMVDGRFSLDNLTKRISR